jgi:hypothetical protein
VGTEHHLHLTADQIGQSGRPAAIGHVNHVDRGHHLEQLAGDMARRPVARRCHVDLICSLHLHQAISAEMMSAAAIGLRRG